MSKILGIDPGLASTGWGIIQTTNNQKAICIDYGLITTKANTDIKDRIVIIAETIKQLAITHSVDRIAIEDIYFTKNISSAISVAKVIGSILYISSLIDVQAKLYTPLQAKMAVVGYGRADKNQIQQMINIILKMNVKFKADHPSDALAIAITDMHFNSTIKRGVK